MILTSKGFQLTPPKFVIWVGNKKACEKICTKEGERIWGEEAKNAREGDNVFYFV